MKPSSYVAALLRGRAKNPAHHILRDTGVRVLLSVSSQELGSLQYSMTTPMTLTMHRKQSMYALVVSVYRPGHDSKGPGLSVIASQVRRGDKKGMWGLPAYLDDSRLRDRL